MNANTFMLAKELSEAPSVSGHEYLAFDTLNKICDGLFERVETLPSGCYIGYRPCGKEGAKTLMFDAHLDEIGFLVKEICDGGFLRVAGVGGIDTRILSASEAIIYGTETIYGVFCSKPPHLMKAGDEKKRIELKDMYIDTGMTKEEVEKYVTIGTPAGFRVETVELKNGLAVGKGFDDKICVATIIRAMQLLKDENLDVNIACLFSGGEEIGYIGGRTGTFFINPDYALVTDVTGAVIPEMPKTMRTTQIGKGGVISFSDTTSRALTKKLIALAKENGITHQVDAQAGLTGTNATVTQVARSGIPTVLVSIPLRNMHTSSEVISIDDVENTAILFAEFAKSFKEE